MEKVKINQYSDLFRGQKLGVRATKILYEYLIEVIDKKTNTTKVCRIELANILGATDRTVKNYLRRLVELDALKYKFNGKIILNPKYYFEGEIRDFDKTIESYSKFITNKKN